MYNIFDSCGMSLHKRTTTELTDIDLHSPSLSTPSPSANRISPRTPQYNSLHNNIIPKDDIDYITVKRALSIRSNNDTYIDPEMFNDSETLVSQFDIIEHIGQGMLIPYMYSI